jgi:hypothetical protein
VSRTAPCVVADLTAGDAGEALTVQYAAYLAEARRYGTDAEGHGVGRALLERLAPGF